MGDKKNFKKMNEADFIKFMKAALADESITTCLREALCIHKLNEEVIELKESLNFAYAEIKDLKENLENTKTELNSLKKFEDSINSAELEELEQYSRRNNVRISGIPEQPGEITDEIVVSLCNEAMKMTPPIEVAEIDRSHRVGKQSNKSIRPILVKFVSYRTKARVVKMKKTLKNVRPLPSAWCKEDAFPALDVVNGADEPESGSVNSTVPVKDRIYINDDLTKSRANIAKECRKALNSDNIQETWTHDGKVFIKNSKDELINIKTLHDLEKNIK